MANISVQTIPIQGNVEYRLLLTCRKGESVTLQYRATPSSGNADVPSAVLVTIAAERGGTPVVSAAATVTNNTTTYDVLYVLSAATTLTMDGRYYLSLKHTLSGGGVYKVEGDLYVSAATEAT